MLTSPKVRLGLVAVLALVVGTAAGLLLVGPDSRTDANVSPSEAGPVGAAAPRIDPGQGNERAPDARLASPGRSPQPTGTGAREIEPPEELRRAEQAYAERLEDTITHLEESANTARAEGNTARAELMERRIEALREKQDALDGEDTGRP